MTTIHRCSLAFGASLSFAVLGLNACKKSNDHGPAKSQKPASSTTLPPQSSAELNEPLVDIDGTVITVGDFQERINKQSPYVRARYTSLERKKEFLDNLIRFEVLAKEAKQRGLDNDPEVVRTMKQVMIQKLMKVQFDTSVKPEDVTEEEMKKFYEEHKAEYNKPEEVRASAIIVKDKKAADKVITEAKGPKGADNKGFRDMVAQYSEDDITKQRGGDLQYFAEDTTTVPQEVIKAAFALEKTGDVAGPIATKQGHYIIKQTGRRKALSKTFEEVKRQIQNRIYRDKRTKAMEDFVAGLKAKAKIAIHEDRLANVRIDTSSAGGPDSPMDPGADPHGGMMMPGAPGMPPMPPMPPAPGAGAPGAAPEGNPH